MSDALALVERLRSAVDAHDLDALVSCFADGYRNETPAHPGRSFVGNQAVRANWTRIFAGMPDITATVTRTTVDGDVVWTEWAMAGTRPDGVAQQLAGVIVFGVGGDRIDWGRFYLEPVDASESGVEAEIGRLVGEGAG
jgi:ketosteroid isomerase-like protein